MGKAWGLLKTETEKGLFCVPFPALPSLGINLVTLFSNVHVFKVISLLKCDFPTFSQIG